MKTEHKEVKNSAHRDLGRNGELEDSTLDSAMSMPRRWFWTTPQEPTPAADPPLPTPKSEQQAPWGNWSETDAAKKAIVEASLRIRREQLLEVQAGTAGKRQKVWPPGTTMRANDKADEKTYQWVEEETQGSSSKAKEDKAE